MNSKAQDSSAKKFSAVTSFPAPEAIGHGQSRGQVVQRKEKELRLYQRKNRYSGAPENAGGVSQQRA